eukprot:4819708-Pyramimonas_sp.AAC.1
MTWIAEDPLKAGSNAVQGSKNMPTGTWHLETYSVHCGAKRETVKKEQEGAMAAIQNIKATPIA